MIRRSPAEYYIKYLLTHPDHYSDESIRNLLLMQQLDYIGKPYLVRLRTSCISPTPFFPEDRTHPRSSRFLRKERIETIYRPDEAMLGAVAILDDMRAKELIENMLISYAHPAWICTALRRQGMDVIEEAVKRYKHYYFNVGLVDSTELKTLMSMRVGMDPSEDEDEKKIAITHTTSMKSDSRRLTAMLSSPISANIMNSLRIGLLPSSLDVARLAEATRVAALGGGLDMAMRGLPAQGRDYALMAKMMTEVIEAVGDPANDLQSDLSKLALDVDTVEVPHIRQLSESYTLSVQPIDMVTEVQVNE